jgi:hypothetical protein
MQPACHLPHLRNRRINFMNSGTFGSLASSILQFVYRSYELRQALPLILLGAIISMS